MSKKKEVVGAKDQISGKSGMLGKRRRKPEERQEVVAAPASEKDEI